MFLIAVCAVANVKGWQADLLTLYISPNQCPISSSQLLSAAEKGAQLWNGVSKIKVELAQAFVRDSLADFLAGISEHVPLIVCDSKFSSSYPMLEKNTAAITRLGIEKSRRYAGVVLNADVTSAGYIKTVLPLLERILAHEIGHVLGLKHSPIPHALMHVPLRADRPLGLDEADKQAIATLAQ